MFALSLLWVQTILRAVASEVDGLITQVTEQSALPKPVRDLTVVCVVGATIARD